MMLSGFSVAIVELPIRINTDGRQATSFVIQEIVYHYVSTAEPYNINQQLKTLSSIIALLMTSMTLKSYVLNSQPTT